MRDIEDIYSLAPLQRGMLFHSLYAPEEGQHVLQVEISIRGPLDAPAFQRAWGAVLAQFSALRTFFSWQEIDQPVQIVRREVELTVTHLDWRGSSATDQSAELEALLARDRKQGYALDVAPLMRLVLIRTGVETHTLIWSCHHLLLDGWSLGLVLRAWLNAYAGRPTSRSRPYRDYIAWLKAQPIDAARQFWQTYLKGTVAGTLLPVMAAPNPTATRYGHQSKPMSGPASDGVRAMAKAHGLTLNTIFQGAWAVLLGDYTGERDVVFGTTVAGRPATLEGVASMVGMFINTQPVRLFVDRDAFLLPWLSGLQAQQAEARQYDYTSLVQIRAWSEVPAKQALFDTLLVFENAQLKVPDAATEQLVLGSVEVHDHTNYSLGIDIVPGETISLRATYDRSSLSDSAVKRILRQYLHVVEQMAARASAKLAEIGVLSAGERAAACNHWNGPVVDFPLNQTIHSLFHIQAERTPEATAATHRGRSLSYRQLACASRSFSLRLRARGVGPDSVVPILAERGLDFLCAVLGTLEAGGAYLALDPHHPGRRMATIVEQSRCSMVVVARDLLPLAVAACDDGSKIEILELETALHGAPTGCPAEIISCAGDLAYVIYTSGSTGTPKGAMLEHRGKVNHLCAMVRQLEMTASDVVAQTAPQYFDISVWQLLAPLITGARTVVFDSELGRDPAAFLAMLEAEAVSIVEVVPAFLTALVETLERAGEGRPTLRRLRWMIPTGEALDAKLCHRWFAMYPHIPLLNTYGPTETSDDTNLFPITVAPTQLAGAITLGHAIPNVAMYVLDGDLEPVPIGVRGELYIGGVAVGRGYLNEPLRTAEAYLPDPFGCIAGSRIYKTGDLCRYAEDGTIEFVSRVDSQVKVRGFRIELGEVEAAIKAHPAVREAAVVLRTDSSKGDPQLVAFVVANESGLADGTGLTPAALRSYLAARVPAYMVPGAIVLLDAMPLNRNGKLDRQALHGLPIGADGSSTTESRAPTAVEREILCIWEELLCRADIRVDDDFFALGGHSLLAVRLHGCLVDRCGVDLPLRDLFELTTIAQLAERVEAIRWVMRAPSADTPHADEVEEIVIG